MAITRLGIMGTPFREFTITANRENTIVLGVAQLTLKSTIIEGLTLKSTVRENLQLNSTVREAITLNSTIEAET